MSFIIDGKEPLYNGEEYCFIKKHRTLGNPNASVWTCTLREEFDLADNGLKNDYTERKKYCKHIISKKVCLLLVKIM